MGKKAKEEGRGLTEEERGVERESRRLRVRARETGVLSSSRASVERPLRPSKQLLKSDGRDIVKKGQRKTKFLFSFPGLLAPVTAGKLGELTNLDTRNPILYIEFPQGRLKLFGTIVYPVNKYLTLSFQRGNGNIVCEDTFESMVVFSEAWWVGSKEGNPDEFKLEFPEELKTTEIHKEFDFSGGAGKPHTDNAVEEKNISKIGKLAEKKEKLPNFEGEEEKSEENDLENSENSEISENSEDFENFESGKVKINNSSGPRRHSERTAGKVFRFTEDVMEEEGEGEDEEEEEEEEGEEKREREKKRERGGNRTTGSDKEGAEKKEEEGEGEGEGEGRRENRDDPMVHESNEDDGSVEPKRKVKETKTLKIEETKVGDTVPSGSTKSRLVQGDLMSMFKKK